MKLPLAKRPLISTRTSVILNAIADELGYDGIIARCPHCTLFDISDAASSAVDFLDSVDSSSLEPHVRRVMVGISKGYGFPAIQEICQIEPLDIANSAYAVLELHRILTLPKKRRNKKHFDRAKTEIS